MFMRLDALEFERRRGAVFLQVNFFPRRQRRRFGIIRRKLEPALDAVRGDDLA